MTDRVKGLTVIFEQNIREDDCEYITNAIRMIKGVHSISNHISDCGDYIIEQRTKDKIKDKILQVFYD
jgi:hypothetical protein